MRQREVGLEETADADLAALATAGDLSAFEELYRRHVEASWRMALAVTANPHDASDAVSDAFTRVFQALPSRPQAADHFLPYLLAAVRNAAIDGLRRSGRQRSVNPGDHPEWASLAAEPGDCMVADMEATLVARAFRSLPERWRSVLWLTEVEKIPAREVADLLGISPNGVAQLAVRARAGLRQRYLQAHLRQNEVRHHCRDTVSRLGAYAAGGLSPRDLSKADQHLAGCEDCRSRLLQLQELTPSLHRAVLPLPAALSALSAAKWHLGSSGAGGTAGTAASGTAASGTVAAGTVAPATLGLGAVVAVAVPAPFVAAVASASLLFAGFVGAGVVEHRQRPAPAAQVAAPAPAAAQPTFAAASVPTTASRATPTGTVGQLLDDAAGAGIDPGAITDVVADVANVAPRLPATPDTLAAVSPGDVHVDVGKAAAGINQRDDSPCPSWRAFIVHLDCGGIDAAPLVVGQPRAALPAPAPAATNGAAAPAGGAPPPAGS